MSDWTDDLRKRLDRLFPFMGREAFTHAGELRFRDDDGQAIDLQDIMDAARRWHWERPSATQACTRCASCCLDVTCRTRQEIDVLALREPLVHGPCPDLTDDGECNIYITAVYMEERGDAPSGHADRMADLLSIGHGTACGRTT
jgi:hypothetical protein